MKILILLLSSYIDYNPVIPPEKEEPGLIAFLIAPFVVVPQQVQLPQIPQIFPVFNNLIPPLAPNLFPRK